MKSIIAVLFVCLFCFSMQAQDLKPAPEGMTAEKLIGKYIEAIGGAARLNKVNSISVWAKTEIQGYEVWITTHTARGNKYFMELGTPDMSIQKQVSDGEKAYALVMGQRMNIDGEDFENIKKEAEMFPEMKYAEMGIVMELLGIVVVNDRDAYKIKLVFPAGNEVFEFYDAETFLKVRTERTLESDKGKVFILSDLGDYRAVKGVKFPYILRQEVGPDIMEMTVTLVQLNKAKASVFLID